MLKPKAASAPRRAKPKQFSLVSAEAQQQMYRALSALQANRIPSGDASGAEIAEIAVCLAAGESCPVVFACSAPGARIVSEVSREAGKARTLTSATLAAMDALLTRSLNGSKGEGVPKDAAPAKSARGSGARKKSKPHPREGAAIVCAGLLDAGTESARDYRAAFHFAARHKLPILYIVANRLKAGTALDLRSVYPEFGVPLFTIDANDAIAAYRVATEALHNARHLRGPSVIEALIVPPNGIAGDPLHLLTAYMERHGNPPQRS